jgi:chromosome segregation ATPase
LNLEADLARLKQQLHQARMLKARAEGQLEALEQDRQRILAEMAELGVTPETLDEEVARLEKEIAGLLEEARRLIPRDLLSGQGAVGA